jgi:EF-P beta-lysylation protein EpmB
MQSLSSPALWRKIQRENFTSIEKLADFLQLDAASRIQLLPHPKFVLNLPKRLAQKIAKNDLQDPIARQFLPLSEELLVFPQFEKDPVKDENFQLTPRLLQKYHGRALLITSGACAMHCRYCFRQNYEYPSSSHGFDQELEILRQTPSIEEIILSGGDPLSLSDETLFNLLDQLSSIDHIKRFRFHTRFPVGIPERLDEAFLSRFANIKRPVWVVLHINHARELDEDIFAALARWQKAGAILLNQAVLLKGVNDNLETLKELCLSLVNHGILPYYLHQLDRVQGAGHFEVDIDKGKALTQLLRAELSGYGVPLYVKEEAYQTSKTPLLP